MGKSTTITLQATDASHQKVANLAGVPTDTTVEELIDDLLQEMRLPKNDANGHPLVYHARLEREERHLHASEVVGAALRENDRIMLHPNVDAGRA